MIPWYEFPDSRVCVNSPHSRDDREWDYDRDWVGYISRPNNLKTRYNSERWPHLHEVWGDDRW